MDAWLHGGTLDAGPSPLREPGTGSEESGIGVPKTKLQREDSSRHVHAPDKCEHLSANASTCRVRAGPQERGHLALTSVLYIALLFHHMVVASR